MASDGLPRADAAAGLLLAVYSIETVVYPAQPSAVALLQVREKNPLRFLLPVSARALFLQALRLRHTRACAHSILGAAAASSRALMPPDLRVAAAPRLACAGSEISSALRPRSGALTAHVRGAQQSTKGAIYAHVGRVIGALARALVLPHPLISHLCASIPSWSLSSVLLPLLGPSSGSSLRVLTRRCVPARRR